MRQLYTGIDLHSNNSHIGIIVQVDNRIFHKRLPNQADVVFAELTFQKGNSQYRRG